ncbi:hypothetical protein [Spongiimicrobium salis]|uniref:hypothetical protein n=1 Tax=Spongiimicrobium salis TaxID=1667022 RepID=UPI00374DB762
MGQTKDLFMMMREEEVATSHFLPTKKELKKSSNAFAQSLIDSGDHNPHEIYAQALRLKEAVCEIESVLKQALGQESFEAFGLTASYRSGGDTINFKEDEMIQILEKKLSDRKDLLKTAMKSEDVIYDSEGVEVPKVSTTPKKSSLAVSF